MKTNLRKIKAFTILEITIVIVIIGILMAATTKFSGDRISLLKNKNIQEQFLDNFRSLQSKNSMSSYYSDRIYKNLIVYFQKGSNNTKFEYKFYDSSILGETEINGGHYQIEQIVVDGKESDQATISFSPYNLGCEINDGSEKLQLGLLVNNSKKYYFQLNADNCRIKTIHNLD